jgi:hypothetical protein
MSHTETGTERTILQALAKGTAELFFYLPLLLLIAVSLLPEWNVWVWLLTLPLCYTGAAAIIGKMPRSRLIVRFGCSLAIGLLHALAMSAWFGGALAIPLLVGAVTGTLVAYRGMAMSLQGWLLSFSNTKLLIGLMLYLLIQPLILLWLDNLALFKGMLVLCGILSIILFAFIANERHLHSETADSVSAAAAQAFKRQNRFLMGILVVLLVLLGMFRSIQRAIEQWLHALIAQIMSWFDRPEQPPAEEAPPPSQPPMDWNMGEPVKEPAAWMVLLEQLLKIAVSIVLIAGAAVLLFYAGRKLYQLAKKFADKLLQRRADSQVSDEEYVDEVESLMNWSKWKKQMRTRLRRLGPGSGEAELRWEQLTSNADKIRFLYTKQLEVWSRKGNAEEPHLTPRELISARTGQLADDNMKREYDDFAAAYEAARYGDKQPLDSQVTTSKNLIERK